MRQQYLDFKVSDLKIKLTCFYHSDEKDKELIVGGTTVGHLMLWTKKNSEQKVRNETNINFQFLTWSKDYEVKDYTLPNQHKVI